MAVEIVPLCSALIDAVHATIDAVAIEHAWIGMARPLSLERRRSAMLAGIADKLPYLVALDAPQVAGWCDVTPRDRAAPLACGILTMGLLPAWRGRGIGGQLIRAALAQCREQAYRRIELTVHTGNAPAVALYRKTGFAARAREDIGQPDTFIVMGRAP